MGWFSFQEICSFGLSLAVAGVFTLNAGSCDVGDELAGCFDEQRVHR